MMKIYLVGGAVRDQLLGLPVKEKDWVVVGASPEVLIQQNYLPVGKDFPVFLHPKTREEYALARTERKVGRGYQGFTFYAQADVTLEQDLARRDLTINAIAQTPEGELIDPYGGEQDIQARLLRHVSPAFAEDPVRILRVARFGARFTEFQVHPETQELMRAMVASGEVNALVPERVWQETARALTYEGAARFFTLLDDCGALPIVFPDLALSDLDLDGLQAAIEKKLPETLRFAVLLHGLTETALTTLCRHLRVPKAYTELALLVLQRIDSYKQTSDLSAEELLRFFEKADAFRRPKRFAQCLSACAVITSRQLSTQQHDTDTEKTAGIPAALIRAYYAAARVSTAPLIKAGHQKADLAKALHQARVEEIARLG